MKMTSTNIKNNIKKLDEDINRNWNIIYKENVAPKGYKRKYDLKKVYNLIIELGLKRAQAKLDLLAVNLGFKSRKEFPVNSIYHTIYFLSEKNELFNRLTHVETIDIKLKRKKSKKGLLQTEELSGQYIKQLKKNLELEIVGYQKELSEFNENSEFDTDGAYLSIAA